jgi:hypothetical protein
MFSGEPAPPIKPAYDFLNQGAVPIGKPLMSINKLKALNVFR